MSKQRLKHLTCGCCGDWFKMWPGYIDQDQDKGWGICKQCQIDACWDDHEMLTDCIDKVAGALGDANREKYLEMDRPMQEVIVYQMLDKGYLKWSFGGRA